MERIEIVGEEKTPIRAYERTFLKRVANYYENFSLCYVQPNTMDALNFQMSLIVETEICIAKMYNIYFELSVDATTYVFTE